MHIQECINKGALNKISVFPNFENTDINDIFKNENIRVSLHLNLVEGKCMSDANELKLIADKDGNFKHSFLGLFKLSLFHYKNFEKDIYKEIRAQVLYWKSILPNGRAFCIDSHQHTHMIPSVFNALLKVLKDENIKTEYMRIPKEPLMPYIKTPSLYFTYCPVNIIKQWLLNFLYLFNRSKLKKYKIPTSYFFGILFSGKMDEKRVNKILPHYIKLSQKHKKDIEILFHPGYLSKNEPYLEDKNILFKKFYLSQNRKTEYDSVINISERRVH